MGSQSGDVLYITTTVALHQHDYSGTVWIGKKRILLRPGDVTLTPANVESCYDLQRKGFHLCVHFYAGGPCEPSTTLPVHWRPGSCAPSVAMRLRHIIHTFRLSKQRGARGQVAQAASSAALHELLLWLAGLHINQRHINRSFKSQAALDRLIAVLEDRFTGPITIPDLAQEVRLSQNYLANLFRKQFGMTIQQYLLNRRIDVARHLLVSTDKSIKSIAYDVGLPDPHYFNKRFRRLTGMSPSAARRTRS
ncbi:MAG: helix-turn-helix transcriptional regulator [Verrucomicrobia bacterium]|nr:helix-turn-helix transcriptional regulator [Verrucomicrobiota bacterium]